MPWIHIEPIPQALTLNEQRVKELLDQGKTIFQIAYKLYMGVEYVREIIYSIRKKEAINHMARLTQEERAEIYRLYREEGMSLRDLAARYYVSHGTIGNIIKKFESVQGMCDALTAADKPMPNTGINPEFDAAVDSMIAEAAVEDSAAPLAEGVQDQPLELEPVIKAPDKLPECVVTALVYRLACIEEEIQHFRAEIDKMEAEHETLAKWKEAHDD